MVWHAKEHVSDLVGQNTTECPAEILAAQRPVDNRRRDLVKRQ